MKSTGEGMPLQILLVEDSVGDVRLQLEAFKDAKRDGREVLAEVKGDSNLQTIPVVILTTSESEADILKSYSLHANCYITKPVSLDGFLKVVKSIDDFWLTVVKLPSEVGR